jgi:ABC-type branched-subunit amino acid transport system ATPase component/ABC-type branched-subunit amino acid transport system permease subunit
MNTTGHMSSTSTGPAAESTVGASAIDTGNLGAANVLDAAMPGNAAPSFWHATQTWEAEWRRRKRASLAVAVTLLVLLATVPLFTGSSFQQARFQEATLYIIAAIGLNLSLGYGGELTLGHPVIMAASAYTAGMLSAILGWPFLPAGFVAIVVGVAVGMAIMLPGLRVVGWYLAMITLFSVLVLPHLVILGEAWTGGEFGLTGIKPVELLGWTPPAGIVYLMPVAALALMWLLARNVMHSSWGLRFRALRDARASAEAVGINIRRTRLAVYVLSAVPAAVAGMLLAYTDRYVSADSFGIGLALLLLTGVVLGGSGTVWGPVLGMIPLVAISFWIGPFSQFNAIALGAALLIGALAFPDGLVPIFAQYSRRRASARTATDAAPIHLETAAPGAVARPQNTAAGSPPIVSATAVSRRFGGVTALNNVTVKFTAGSVVGLVGPNGSGKSTFLNILSGFIKPDQGTIEIGGVDVAGMAVDEIARSGVGRSFQVPQLIDELTALENIEIGLVGKSYDGIVQAALRLPAVLRRERDRRMRAVETLAAIGLPPDAIGTPAGDLPLGLKRVVEIGRAVVASPSLLLLDEPAAGLNNEERLQLGALLRQLKAVGMSILVVEHNVPFVMSFCDEVLLLEAGTLTCRARLGGALPERLLNYLNYGVEEDPPLAVET